MDNQQDVQLRLIRLIREQLPEHVSLVDEIADRLEISNDSAYRRIRGEKPLSLPEVQKLAGSYHISLDDLLGNPKGSVTFRTSFLEEGSFSFSDWMRNLLGFTLRAGQHEDTEAIFILNELSIFHLIQVPELCAFKLFFWRKSNLDFPSFREMKFSARNLDEEALSLSREITDYYSKVNTIEFTTAESLNSILKQVLYYSEAGYFQTREDALLISEKLHDLVDHQQQQAARGFKYPRGSQAAGQEGNFQLYYNDLILADNTILVKTGDFRATYLTSNAINLMECLDRDFFEYNYRWARNLLSKSIPISGTAEMERNRFFRILHDNVDRVAAKI